VDLKIFEKNKPVFSFKLKPTYKNPPSHKVESGETLSTLAKRYKLVIDSILEWNKMKSANELQEGKLLQLSKPEVNNREIGNESGDKKKSLDDKVKKAKEQGTELQKMVDDKFSGKGPMTASKLSKEKIKGQVELIKRTTGMEDDPKKKADLKAKMQELAKKAQQEDAAMAELEDKNKDVIAAEEEKAKKGGEKETPEEKEAKDKKAAADKEAADKEAADKETPEEKTAREEKEAADKEAKDKEAKDKEAAEKEAAEKEAAEKTKQDELLAGYKEELKKAQDAGEEDKAKEIQGKIDAISQKESWQLENSELGRIYESELRKLQNNSILNESKYQVNSIKDAFSRLM
jgi:hypothetical protein